MNQSERFPRNEKILPSERGDSEIEKVSIIAHHEGEEMEKEERERLIDQLMNTSREMEAGWYQKLSDLLFRSSDMTSEQKEGIFGMMKARLETEKNKE